MTNEKIEKVINDRFKEVAKDYKRLKMMIVTQKITLFEIINGIEKQLQEDDSRWTEFCSKVFDKDSIPNRILQNIIDNTEYSDEIYIIWTKEGGNYKYFGNEFFIMNSKKDGEDSVIFIKDKNLLKVYILS